MTGLVVNEFGDANGNVTIASAGDVANNGSIYATQNTPVDSQGQVSNTGTVAAIAPAVQASWSVRSGLAPCRRRTNPVELQPPSTKMSQTRMRKPHRCRRGRSETARE